MKRVKTDVKPPPATHIRANNAASQKARTEVKRRHVKTNGKDHRKASYNTVCDTLCVPNDPQTSVNTDSDLYVRPTLVTPFSGPETLRYAVRKKIL